MTKRANETENPFCVPTLDPFGLRRPASAVAADAPEGSYEYRARQSTPGVAAEEVETAASALDVRILWGRNTLAAGHLSPPRSFYLGEEESRHLKCDYFVPEEKLGTTRAPLVLASASAATSVVLLPGAVGTVELPGEPPLSIHETIAQGRARPCMELAGAFELPIVHGASVRQELGDLVFEVKAVHAARKAVAAFSAAALATGALLHVGASAAGHVGLLLALATFVPPLADASTDTVNEEQRYLIQQYLDAAAEEERAPEQTADLTEVADRDNEGGTGQRSIGEEGSMGNPASHDQGKRYAIEGPADNPNPQVARMAALRDAAEFGVIGLLNVGAGGDPNAPTAPWGEELSRGTDPLSARGNMWGNEMGESFGAGGLGLSGIGEGGGGRGEGIGLGSVGTIAHGAGTGTGQGFGTGGGRIGRGHHVRPPTVRMGQTQVSGRIPPEVIQRIVRQNFGRFRLCYENGLRGNPSLQGRVVVRFIIGRDGRVSNVSGGGDLPDANVTSCVTRAFYGLSFPQPEGGTVQVGYPIVFTPGGS